RTADGAVGLHEHGRRRAVHLVDLANLAVLLHQNARHLVLGDLGAVGFGGAAAEERQRERRTVVAPPAANVREQCRTGATVWIGEEQQDGLPAGAQRIER